MHLHHYIDGICAGYAAVPGPCGERQKFRMPKPPSLSERIASAQAEVEAANERLEFLLTLSAD